MTLSLLVAALALSATEEVDQQKEEVVDPPKWELFTAAAGGLRLSERGGGGFGMLGVNRRFGWFRPELVVGLGAYDQPVDVVIVIRIGTRIEWQRDGNLKPYLWVAFAHNHESGWQDTIADPVRHVLGISEVGVHHRSGAEAGVGLAYDLPRVTHLRVGSRLTFTHFFGDSFSPRYLDFTIHVGAVF